MTETECIVAFSPQQWLYERSTRLPYMYIAQIVLILQRWS